jgi:hypothetical protein
MQRALLDTKVKNGNYRSRLKNIIKQIPILRDLAWWFYQRGLFFKTNQVPFPGSAAYWENRYSAGGNSGVGSYERLAEFKASVVNRFTAMHDVRTVIEFGCGDGNQLRFMELPAYIGFDVSNAAIIRCQELFQKDETKSFRLMSQYNGERADLGLSLDVIYHLVEDNIFERYMQMLFHSSIRFVIVYASNFDDNSGKDGSHIRHRKFTR